MSETAAMNGAEWLARALAGTGMSHVFFVESTLRRTLLHLSDLGVRPILAHSEKAAAYMADGYARVAGRPGVCLAQSVGAANLAAGLQDAWLGRSPVLAFSGRKEPSLQHRNAYQEIPHAPLFAAVTKFSSPVEATADLPRLVRYAWRAALAETPRPTHLDVNGVQGEVIELGQTHDAPTLEPQIPRVRGRPLERGIAVVDGRGKTVLGREPVVHRHHHTIGLRRETRTAIGDRKARRPVASFQTTTPGTTTSPASCARAHAVFMRRFVKRPFFASWRQPTPKPASLPRLKRPPSRH